MTLHYTIYHQLIHKSKIPFILLNVSCKSCIPIIHHIIKIKDKLETKIGSRSLIETGSFCQMYIHFFFRHVNYTFILSLTILKAHLLWIFLSDYKVVEYRTGVQVNSCKYLILRIR